MEWIYVEMQCFYKMIGDYKLETMVIAGGPIRMAWWANFDPAGPTLDNSELNHCNS